jgi:hypothetical protein
MPQERCVAAGGKICTANIMRNESNFSSMNGCARDE